jgi:hypothetical protein
MTETNIILAVIGMVGLFATATIWQRANRITDATTKQTRSTATLSHSTTKSSIDD